MFCTYFFEFVFPFVQMCVWEELKITASLFDILFDICMNVYLLFVSMFVSYLCACFGHILQNLVFPFVRMFVWEGLKIAASLFYILSPKNRPELSESCTAAANVPIHKYYKTLLEKNPCSSTEKICLTQSSKRNTPLQSITRKDRSKTQPFFNTAPTVEKKTCCFFSPVSVKVLLLL